MTTNQIAYLRNQEEARHNRASEAVSAVQAHASEMQALAAQRQAQSSQISASAALRSAEGTYLRGLTDWDTRDARRTTASAAADNAKANLLNAETNKVNADTNAMNANTNYLKYQSEDQLNDAKVVQIQSQLDKLIVEVENMRAQTGSTRLHDVLDVVRTLPDAVGKIISNIGSIAAATGG